MNAIPWTLLALAATFALATAAVRLTRRRQPPLRLESGAPVGATSLERLARRSLALVLLLTAAAAAVVARRGLEASWQSTPARLTATVLLLLALAVFAGYMRRVWVWARRDDGSLDERDRAILAGAPAWQAPAMLLTLAAWTIGLSESYRAAGSIPPVVLQPVFWSCLIASVLAQLLGVLIGYRRQ